MFHRKFNEFHFKQESNNRGKEFGFFFATFYCTYHKKEMNRGCTVVLGGFMKISLLYQQISITLVKSIYKKNI